MPARKYQSFRHGPEAEDGTKDPRQLHREHRSTTGRRGSRDESSRGKVRRTGSRVHHALQNLLGVRFKGPNRIAHSGDEMLRSKPPKRH